MEQGKIMINRAQEHTEKGSRSFVLVTVIGDDRKTIVESELELDDFARAILNGSEVPMKYKQYNDR